MFNRVGQVVHQYGVFGAVVTARAAVTTERAGFLLDTRSIGAILKGDIDRWATERCAQGLGRFFQRLQLRQRAEFIWIGIGAEHVAGAIVIGIQQLVVVLIHLRPVRFGENARVDFQCDIGVDQRGATHAAAEKYIHAAIQAQIVKAVSAQQLVRAGSGDAGVGHGCSDGVRIFARTDFPAAFEHRHLAASARQPRSADAAAVTRPDDDHVITVASLTDRFGDFLSHFPAHLSVGAAHSTAPCWLACRSS